jgi:amino acid transporter
MSEVVTLSDEAYLAQLGYKQQLRRELKLLSSAGLQFTMIALMGGLALTFGYGLTTVGPLMILAWIIGGVLQMAVGVSIAEGTSAYPLAGGAYQIIRKLAKPALAWQAGWWLLTAHIVAMAGEAIGLAPTMASWVGIKLTGKYPVIFGALILIVLATLINVAGVKVTAFINNVLGVAAEVTAICIAFAVLIGGAFLAGNHFHSLGWLGSTHGVAPAGSSLVLPFADAILLPAFVLSGFDASGTASEETHQASRTVPKAMLIANFAAYLVGTVALILFLLAIKDFTAVSKSVTPLPDILRAWVGGVPATTFEVLAFVSLFVNMVILQLTAARVIWAQSREGETPAPKFLLKLNKERIPVNATLLVAVVAMLFCFWSSVLNILLSTATVLWAAGYGLLVAVIWYAKRRRTLPEHSFTPPLSNLVAAVGMIWSVVLIAILIRSNVSDIGGGFAVVVGIGAIIYLVMMRLRRRPLAPVVEPAADAKVKGSGK